MSTTETSTELLQRWQAGDGEALDRLLPLVYAELRSLAARELAGHRGHQTLQPTALVNDVFVRLLGARQLEFTDTAHFFHTAARAMRQILVDRARRAATDKRGGDWQRDTFTKAMQLPIAEDTQLPALDQALGALADVDDRLARVVELRWFAGLSVGQVAELLGLDERTVYRDWALAKAWLRDRLQA